MESRRQIFAEGESMKGSTMAAKGVEVPPWFPEADWVDDVRMKAMMEAFLDRSIMDDAYDNKMLFWFEVIRQFCNDTCTPVVSVSALRTAFRRKGKTPVCLTDVFREMANHEITPRTSGNTLTPLHAHPGAAWDPLTEGWFSWGLRKGVSASTSSAWSLLSPILPRGVKQLEDNELFVHPETLAHVADELADEYENSVLNGSAEQVVSWDCFARLYAGRFKNELVLDKVLGELQRRKRVRLGTTGPLKVVKFSNESISSTDVEIAKLQRLEWALSKNQEEMEKKMDGYKEDAKKYLVQGKRELAKARLRQRKALEKKAAVLHGSLDNVHELLSQIRLARTQAEVLKIFGGGARTIKDVFEAAGIKGGSDDVYKLMDDVRDQLEDIEEISGAISESAAPASSRIDQEELEEELKELLAEEGGEEESKENVHENVIPAAKKKRDEKEDSFPELPSVPGSPPRSDADEDLSARLSRLRQSDF